MLDIYNTVKSACSVSNGNDIYNENLVLFLLIFGFQPDMVNPQVLRRSLH